MRESKFFSCPVLLASFASTSAFVLGFGETESYCLFAQRRKNWIKLLFLLFAQRRKNTNNKMNKIIICDVICKYLYTLKYFFKKEFYIEDKNVYVIPTHKLLALKR